jgi:ferrous iron transport protein A
VEEIIIKLSQLRTGQEAIIKSFNSKELFLKLMEMGCLPGEKIVVEKIAPMGDPISISVSGYHLSLRLNEAEEILVEINN